MKRFILLFSTLILLTACGSASESEPTTNESNNTSGELTVTDVTANLSLPTDTGAVYMTITNGTDTDDSLVNADVPGCGVVELHEMSMDGDVMVMRQVEGGEIPVPAGATVTLKRGGLHVMCIEKAEPTAVGETVPVTLTFANAGTIEVQAEVIDITEMDHGDMESMHGNNE